MTELGKEILRLKSEGLTYKKIAAKLDCSLGTISYYVGEGQKEKSNTRNRNRKSKMRAYLQELKQVTPCADCKENYPYYMMDFDHLEDKLFNISRVNNSWEEMLIEIDKCEIVCANCHRTRTYSRLVIGESSTLELSEFYK